MCISYLEQSTDMVKFYLNIYPNANGNWMVQVNSKSCNKKWFEYIHLYLRYLLIVKQLYNHMLLTSINVK